MCVSVVFFSFETMNFDLMNNHTGLEFRVPARLLVAKRKEAKWSGAESKVGSRWMMAQWLANNRTEQKMNISLSLSSSDERGKTKAFAWRRTDGRTTVGDCRTGGLLARARSVRDLDLFRFRLPAATCRLAGDYGDDAVAFCHHRRYGSA